MSSDELIPTTLLQEIIFEILLKLPVESLLRCKSICKEWYSLISSDHHFIKSHYTLSSTNITYEHHRLIYSTYERNNTEYGEPALYSCPLYDVLFHKSANNPILLENPIQQTRGFTIVGSCNGLMCLLGGDDNTLFIYNPSTRTTNILPPSKQGAGWLFDSYGFGYDETTHDYKVVKLSFCAQTSPPYWDTMIYSLKAGSWKEIGRFPGDFPKNYGKFLNGALHWAACDGRSGWRLIVSLDLEKETYGEVLGPEYAEGSKTLALGVLGESLCVFCNYDESCVVDVWVMKVYGVKDSWTKSASISHPTTPPMYLDIFCILKDGKVLMRFGPQLLIYDSKDSSSPEIENFDEIDEACVVVESLVSPFPPLALADDDEN